MSDVKRLAKQAGRSLRSWEHFISALPGQLQAILDQVRAGSAAVDFRVHDADHAVDRLVDGLVTAASVLAGAGPVSRRASPMVGPFSLPGLIAAGVGVLTWQRLIARRGERSWVSRVADFINVARS
jgi:ubiquinone biosynthesis protein